MSPALLTLYDSILVSVLSEWICDNSVCALDSAVCNHNLRTSFLILLSKCSLLSGFSPHFVHYPLGVYSWMLLRNLKLTMLFLNHCDEESHPEVDLLLSRVNHINFLIAPLEEIVELVKGKTVNHMVLRYDRNPSLNKISKVFYSVLHLDLSDVELKPSSYQMIVNSAPNLKLISLGKLDDLKGLSVFHHVQATFQTSSLISGVESPVTYTIESHPSYYCCDEVPSWVFRVDGVAYEMTQLEAYYTSNNLSDVELDFIAPCVERLTHVRFEYASLQKLLRLVVSKCCMLKEFEVQVYEKEGKVNVLPCILQSSRTLTKLSLSRINITDEELEKIASCCLGLQSVSLCDIKFSTSTITLLKKNCADLCSLCVKSTDKTFSCSSLAVDLHSISFCSSDDSGWTESKGKRSMYTSEPLYQKEEFFALHPALEAFSTTLPVDERVISALVQHCPLLKSVAISSSLKPTAKCIRLLASCKNLSKMSLAGVSGLTDKLLDLLLCDKPYFEVLELHDCSGFTEHVCQIIAKYCRFLKRLKIAHKCITDDDAQHLVDNCKKLKDLDLEDCPLVTNHCWSEDD